MVEQSRYAMMFFEGYSGGVSDIAYAAKTDQRR
jgi:hypothetical protein